MIYELVSPSGRVFEVERPMSDPIVFGTRFLWGGEWYERTPERRFDEKLRRLGSRWEFRSTSMCRAHRGEHGEWVIPPGVKRVDKRTGQPIVLSHQDVKEYCAVQSDGDSARVEWDW